MASPNYNSCVGVATSLPLSVFFMRCPFCNNENTKVVDSRETQEGRAIRRRRECEKCQARFSTYEEIEIFRLQVVKKDGNREEYDREKIERGLRRAFEKRPNAEEKIEKILGEVEYALHEKRSNEIPSREIGSLIMTKLRDADEVAYIRFASVYKSFGSIKSFKKAIETFE
jgi:transcriptional repressor NrdR